LLPFLLALVIIFPVAAEVGSGRCSVVAVGFDFGAVAVGFDFGAGVGSVSETKTVL
jgi:hypothetical protein